MDPDGIKCVPVFMKIGQMLQTFTWPYKHSEDDGFIILRFLHVIKNRLGINAIILWNNHENEVHLVLHYINQKGTWKKNIRM